MKSSTPNRHKQPKTHNKVTDASHNKLYWPKKKNKLQNSHIQVITNLRIHKESQQKNLWNDQASICEMIKQA